MPQQRSCRENQLRVPGTMPTNRRKVEHNVAQCASETEYECAKEYDCAACTKPCCQFRVAVALGELMSLCPPSPTPLLSCFDCISRRKAQRSAHTQVHKPVGKLSHSSSALFLVMAPCHLRYLLVHWLAEPQQQQQAWWASPGLCRCQRQHCRYHSPVPHLV